MRDILRAYGSWPGITGSANRPQLRNAAPGFRATIQGNRQIETFKTSRQCAFKLAELVETHMIAAKAGGDQDKIMEEFAQIKQKDMHKDGK